MPKRPTVKAIAPNAPSGASRMIIASTRKTTSAKPSISARTGRPACGCAFSEKPNNSDSSNTGNTSPFANAPSIVSGITPSANATSPGGAACFTYGARRLASR